MLGFLPALHGQNLHPSFYEFTETQGLPGSHVYFVFEDSQKYIWISTTAGVARYDGSSFEIFTVDEGLTDNEVFSIHEDSQGRIWMMTYSGIPSYYLNGKIHNPGNTPCLRQILFDSYLSSFYEDKSGTVYLGGKDGKLYSLDKNEKVSLVYDSDIHSIHYQYTNSQGKHCFFPNYLETIELSEEGPITHVHADDEEIIPGETPRMVALGDGRVLIGKASRLLLLHSDFSYQWITWPGINGGQIINLHRQGDWVWVCTTDGVFQIMLKHGNVPSRVRHFFPGIIVTSVLTDHEGGTWFGTPSGALYCPFLQVLTNRVPFANIPNPVTALNVGRMDGEDVAFLGYENGTVSYISMETLEEKVLCQIERAGSSQRIVQVVPMNTSGDLLIVGHKGLTRYVNGHVSQCITFSIHQLARMKGQPDCLCHYGGFAFTDVTKCGEKSFGLSNEQVNMALQNSRCISSVYDEKGRLWVAGLNQLIIAKEGRQKSISFRKEGGYSFRPSVLVASEGNLWMGTIGAGLLRYDGKRVWSYLPGNGMPSKIVNAVHIDPGGRVWVGTDKGVSYFELSDDPLRPNFQLYGKAEGLPGDNVSAITSIGETILVATDLGLCSFPRNRDNDRTPPITRIKSVEVNGVRTVPTDSLLTLDHRQNALGISFRGISYRSLGDISYRYRLNDADSLSRKSSIGFVEYPSLAPGMYKFEVQSIGAGTDIASDFASIEFEIKAPFWRRWWFVALVIGLIVLGAGFVVRLVFQSKQRRQELINRSLLAEQKLLQVQMNPHFIFNSLNSIQELFLENKKEAANDYLADFSSMVRMILENVRETTILLSEELRFIRLYLRMESLRLSNRFEYVINVHPSLPIGAILIPPMLIQPFLENAIWHGLAPLKNQKGKLTLDFRSSGETIICTIKDNGIGRERSRELKQQYNSQHKSMAMNISRERIESLNEVGLLKTSLEVVDEYDETGAAAGTTVILRFPTKTLKVI